MFFIIQTWFRDIDIRLTHFIGEIICFSYLLLILIESFAKIFQKIIYEKGEFVEGAKFWKARFADLKKRDDLTYLSFQIMFKLKKR